MLPLDVMPYAMRLELECGQLRSAASIAEKAAPYVHPKMAPRVEQGGDHELTIKVIEGCRNSTPRLPNCRRSRLVASVHLLFVYFPRLWAGATSPYRQQPQRTGYAA
jgi:hypothetical protein